MKKFLLASAALIATVVSVPAIAADLPARPIYKAPPPLVYAFSWTGFYIGGNIGAAWGERNVTDSFFGLNYSNGSDGVFIGGGQIGGNFQFDRFVIGAEWDIDWMGKGNSGNGVFVPALGNTIQVTSNNSWVSTLAARFGVAFDRVLLYVKAGGGWVGNNGFTVTNVTTGTSVVGSNSYTAGGGLIGAGVEWAFLNNWTMKVEYDYLSLDNRTFVVPATVPVLAGDTFTSSRNVQMVKLGFNYLFNSPGVARY
jgi:outer membrane immunogenic protein